MPANRHRHANTIHAAKFFAMVVAGMAICGGGLGFVWCKNQMYTTGLQIKKCEGELVQLRSRNEAALTNIAKFSSTAELLKRHRTGCFKLEDIGVDFTAIAESARPAAEGGLRPVANERKQE